MVKKLELCFVSLVIMLSGVKADTDGPWQLEKWSGYSGEIVLNELTGSSMFYWLFECLNGNITTDSKPLIIWLQGGPGCSGETGMLFENIGPFYINENMMPVANNYTWTEKFHVMTIDYPYGSGYSFAGSFSDYRNTTQGSSDYLYYFLQKLAKKYPSWTARDWFIFGESYAGHWIPGIAHKILMENQASNVTGRVKLPLKGVALGDPLVNAYVQSQYYAEYAFNTGLINSDEKGIIEEIQTQVISLLNAGRLAEAEPVMERTFNLISEYAGGINVLNMRVYKKNYDLGKFPEWLNLESTKEMLHVPKNVNWVECNQDVYKAFYADIMTSMSPLFPYILDNIKVMFYNGQDDLIVNSVGTRETIADIDWKHTEHFLNSIRKIWKFDNEIAGYTMDYNNLRFVLVLKSGHMVPHDQPVHARDMVTRFIEDRPWD